VTQGKCQMVYYVECDETGECGKPRVDGTKYCARCLPIAKDEARELYRKARADMTRARKAMRDAGLTP
jgi:hypothetical protein